MGTRIEGRHHPRSATLSVKVTKRLAEAVRQAAHGSSLSISAWIVMALSAQLKRWDDATAKFDAKREDETSEWRSGWPKDEPCHVCREAHDPFTQHAAFGDEVHGAMLEIVRQRRGA
jgi:hypothetical protein